MIWILKNLSLTKGYFGKNSKGYQNVTKIYSVGFSHDADHDGKRIKQSDWPWKFWGCRVFHYSWVGVVLPLSVNKWPNLHPSDPPHPPPPTKFLHSPHENLMAMKVCCRQKNFSPPLKFWKFPLQLLDSVEAYLYVKNLTCCFESLWTRLATSTWNDWINVILLLLPYHMQKTNFITQLILEIKLTHYLLAL